MATNHFGMNIKNYICGINWKCRHVLRFSIGEKIKYNIMDKKYMSDAYRFICTISLSYKMIKIFETTLVKGTVNQSEVPFNIQRSDISVFAISFETALNHGSR